MGPSYWQLLFYGPLILYMCVRYVPALIQSDLAQLDGDWRLSADLAACNHSGAALALTLLRARHIMEDDTVRAKMTFRMSFYVIVFIGFWVCFCKAVG
jgi:hypothetical protein